jgi:hypothetical protein
MQTGLVRNGIFSRLMVGAAIGIGVVLVGCSSSEDSASAEAKRVQSADLLKQFENEKPKKGTRPPKSIKGKLGTKESTPAG